MKQPNDNKCRLCFKADHIEHFVGGCTTLAPSEDTNRHNKGRFTHSMPCPCPAAKGLECVFPIWLTHCGRVWFTVVMPCSDHAVLLKARAQPSLDGRAVALRRTAWSEHGMASVNQTRPYCVNQMGTTHSKPLAARHGRGTAWARHGNGMLCVNRP